jgi:hypothetical protein
MDNSFAIASFSLIFFLLAMGLFVLAIAGMWKVFEKAGQPGWACIVPVYNLFVLVRIVGKPAIWVLFAFIPFVNLVIGILLAIELAKCFGKGTGFAVGMIFLPMVFYPILGFGDARYQRPQIQGGQAIARSA